MDDEAYEHASIAQAAYDYHYLGAEKAQEILEKEYPGYIIDPEHSDLSGVTVVKPDGSAVIGYRGTNPFNSFDWTADLLIATGYPTIGYSNMIPGTRFDTAEKLYKKASEQYPVSSVTGHSLGGSITDYISRRHGVKGISFNPGETPLEFFAAKTPSKTKVYTTGKDPISISAFASGNYENVITVPSKATSYSGLHAHSNFLRKKMDPVEIGFKKPTLHQATYSPVEHTSRPDESLHTDPKVVQRVQVPRPCRLVSFRPLKLASGRFVQRVACDPTKDGM
jgi:hypothetical protein